MMNNAQRVSALVLLSRESAHAVLWCQEGAGAGWWEPGDFVRKLIAAALQADPVQRSKLAVLFPDYTTAAHFYQMVDGGRELLMLIARGEIETAAVNSLVRQWGGCPACGR